MIIINKIHKNMFKKLKNKIIFISFSKMLLYIYTWILNYICFKFRVITNLSDQFTRKFEEQANQINELCQEVVGLKTQIQRQPEREAPAATSTSGDLSVSLVLLLYNLAIFDLPLSYDSKFDNFVYVKATTVKIDKS